MKLALLICLFIKSSFAGEACKAEVKVDFDSLSLYPNFNFDAKWTHQKHFWRSEDFDFESRFMKNPTNPNHIKVFLIPYSHNDPGWKQTFEGYYYSLTRKILNNSVAKLSEFRNMTFVWSEIVFLAKWWDEASTYQKETLKQLVKEGRFEILTGGWVMPDEATPSLFALINQLVEGHQWIYKNLNVSIKAAWAIDPFGHSSTMPYLLKKADIDGMMIQRIHYNWKHFLAEQRKGDFIWYPRWSSDPNDSIICHNAHYDLYPTKHSCGPNPIKCMGFDFRSIPGKLDEHVRYMTPVVRESRSKLSEDLVGQYQRTASLTRHNLVLTSLGGDFRFEDPLEWDQQYENYRLLFHYINSRPQYEMTAKFATLSEYFKEIQARNSTLPSFRGDFFPYSDIIFPFSPAYWTGFYGTRPFWKKLSREVEDELLKAEILFTFAYNLMLERNHSSSFRVLYKNYDNLVHTRRAIALFQHHDGITGTSPRTTMLDYAKKLLYAWNFSRHIQKLSIEVIWRNELRIRTPPLTPQTTRKSLGIVEKEPLKMFEAKFVVKKLILFNSLAWNRSQLVRVVVEDPNVIVKRDGEMVEAQINPKLDRSNAIYKAPHELIFIAELPALSLITYEIQKQSQRFRRSKRWTHSAKVSCRNCQKYPRIKKKSLFLENPHLKLHLDNETGLPTRLENKQNPSVKTDLKLTFGRYDASYGSGAYLLRPFTSKINPIDIGEMHLIEGPIISELIFLSNSTKLSITIVRRGSLEIMSSILISNEFVGDAFGEYFMRFETNLNNSFKSPVFYTDTNGHAVEKRVTNRRLPYQANHYPITSFAYIQDESKGLRLSLAVDRAHGLSSIEMGRVELIFDRRLQFDDARGMDEGVMDSELAVSNYAIILEALPEMGEPGYPSWEPSINLQKLSKYLNSQPTIFTYDALDDDPNGEISLLSNPFPEDVHLLNLRTIQTMTNQGIKSYPSRTALMTLQFLGHNKSRKACGNKSFDQLGSSLTLNHSIEETNLVGTRRIEAFGKKEMKYLLIGKPYEVKSYKIHFCCENK